MARTDPAVPVANIDFWPARSLDSWRLQPEETFLAWLSQQRVVGMRQMRESSVETYKAMFSAWIQHLQKLQLNMLEATDKEATSFFQVHKVEPVTRRRYLQLLDKVYRNLRSAGWEQSSPVHRELLKERELEIALPVGLEEADQAALADHLEGLSGWKGARDRGMAALLLGAGLRANELADLSLEALTDSFRLHIEPVGVHRAHTTLVLPDGPWRAWLRAWLDERALRGIPGRLLCPATLGGSGYSPSGLFRRVSDWFEKAGVKTKKQGPSILRNTFARCALTCGRYTPLEVQEFLGHEELRATSRHMSD